MTWMECWTPKPATNMHAAPATPRMVMNMRCLYLKRLRAVTLWVKLMRLHTGLMCSSKIFEPPEGGLGNSSAAGFSPSSRRTASAAGKTEHNPASTSATTVIAG